MWVRLKLAPALIVVSLTFIMPFELEAVENHEEWASQSYKTQVCFSSHFIVPLVSDVRSRFAR